MRILHVDGFSEREKKQKIDDIKKNIRDAIIVSLIHFFIIKLSNTFPYTYSDHNRSNVNAKSPSPARKSW